MPVLARISSCINSYYSLDCSITLIQLSIEDHCCSLNARLSVTWSLAWSCSPSRSCYDCLSYFLLCHSRFILQRSYFHGQDGPLTCPLKPTLSMATAVVCPTHCHMSHFVTFPLQLHDHQSKDALHSCKPILCVLDEPAVVP